MNSLRRILAKMYWCVVAIRGWLYDHGLIRPYRSRIPVVCVGNVTAGGNGKTPLCLAIALELRKRGHAPAILSRGYKGSQRGPHKVTPQDSCIDVGDEAVLMAEAGFPVFVSRKRVAGIKLIEQDPSINVVILDDGFQHRALARSLDIVSIFVGSEKAVNDFLAGELLPAGLFREPRERGLQRARIVVLSHRTVQGRGKLPEVDPRVLALLPESASVFRSFLIPSAVTRLEGGQELSAGTICALAAIANPDGFFQSLETLGFSVMERFSYPDHYAFNAVELRGLLTSHPQYTFVCTAKDAVKLREMPLDVRERFAVLSVTAQIVPSDAFFVQVERAVLGQQVAQQHAKVTRL